MKRPYGRNHRMLYRRLLLLVGAVALVGVVIALVFQRADQGHEARGSLEGRFAQDHVVYEGVEYEPKNGLSTFLIMGIDTTDEGTEYNGPYRSGGQCDFLLLTVIDTHDKVIHRIQIDRDTMAEITVLGVLGNELGTNTHQICLAHGFGDGKAQSCRYTVEAVQRLMYGISIDGYYAMNLDGIPVLNDLLGGVTVTIEDDFSAFDPAMVPGAIITLQGVQTELFVRSRMEIGDGTNFSRMRRQRQFLNNAISLSFERIREDNGFFATLLDGLNPYITTDIARGRILNEANRAASYTVEETINPEGQYVDGADGFIEFHVDQQALMELVLGLFYEPV